MDGRNSEAEYGPSRGKMVGRFGFIYTGWKEAGVMGDVDNLPARAVDATYIKVR